MRTASVGPGAAALGSFPDHGGARLRRPLRGQRSDPDLWLRAFGVAASGELKALLAGTDPR